MLNVRATMKNPQPIPSEEVRKMMVDKHMLKLKRLNIMLKHPRKPVQDKALEQIKNIAYGTETIDPYSVNTVLCVNVARLIAVKGQIDWNDVSKAQLQE